MSDERAAKEQPATHAKRPRREYRIVIMSLLRLEN